jgi:HD-GYP domain-containing protein (c-di-GMP phosphodiesterase class II)
VITRFQTRAFLLCFVPFAVLLACSFWLIHRQVQSTVRDGLLASMRENQLSIARIHIKSDLENNRFLRVAGENTALKAGMELLRQNPDSATARRTVEDQLLELCQHMGFDFLLVSSPDGTPMAGVVRQSGKGPQDHGPLTPIDTTVLGNRNAGLLFLGGNTFQVASVPIDENEENIGILSVGEFFNFSEFTTPAVLVHDGKVVESNLAGIPLKNLNASLAACVGMSECDFELQEANWISLPMQSFPGGYVLRSLENVNHATAPVESRLHNLFLSLSFACVLVALLCSYVASRSIVKPIDTVVSHLRNAALTGVLPEFEGDPSSIMEIRELAEIYDRAALSVRAAGEDLQKAYLEFVGSLANALDARDRYTSGHSQRVSELSCGVAVAMQLDPVHVERIRLGALLHDIGKIGVADSVLQKPGKLTDEEFALVKEHPVIGRRILEGVQGFTNFLGAVELHHENWNGSGYPKGQKGEETPIDARIIHVSDAYDAMTTDRSYRRGMTHERAISIIVENAGIQFDPRIVEVFINLPHEFLTRHAQIPELVAEGKRETLAVAV